MSKLQDQVKKAVIDSGKIEPIIERGKSYYDKGKTVVPTAAFETITPKMATEWLEKNGFPQSTDDPEHPQHKNRPAKAHHIAHMGNMIKAGDWKLNGESIKLGPDGELLDGQNRLYACIMADVPFTSLVVRNVPYDAFDTIDTGRNRSVGDILAIHGAEYASWTAAGVRTLNAMVLGIRDRDSRLSPLEGVRRWVEAQKSAVPFHDSAMAIRRCVSQRIIRPGIGIACHQLFSQKDREAADKFFEDLGKGVDLSEDDPVYHLRQRFQRAASDKRSKLTAEEIWTLTIRAWNGRREGRKVNRLQGQAQRKDGSYLQPAVE